jgi:hypothetical protein
MRVVINTIFLTSKRLGKDGYILITFRKLKNPQQ